MKEQTVSLGTKIVAANEKLTSINMIDLFEMIAHPEPSLRNQTEVLRSIQRMDSAKYNLMKKSLPYFVCAHFDPDYRRKENFSSVSLQMSSLGSLEPPLMSLGMIFCGSLPKIIGIGSIYL